MPPYQYKAQQIPKPMVNRRSTRQSNTVCANLITWSSTVCSMLQLSHGQFIKSVT
ncbi:uncharacterized, partial [Tachysurus ichikawai]